MNVKKSKSVILLQASTAALLMSTCFVSYGGMNADITMSGALAPKTCHVRAPNEGVYDYGNVSARGREYVFPEITQRWQVDCDGDINLNIVATDNRQDSLSRASRHYYGLGGENSEPVGYYRVIVSRAMVYSGGDKIVSNKNDFYLTNGEEASFNIPGSKYVFDLTVQPKITDMQRLAREGKIKIDGSLSLNFKYGI